VTPLQLDDALTTALAATRWRWTAPLRRRRYAIWLTCPTVTIGGLRWRGTAWDRRGFGYTRRQARQMRQALKPVLRGCELESLVLAVMRGQTG
jgi:hypothetical protein